jgi:DNA-binding MarR family transcriptional regulator
VSVYRFGRRPPAPPPVFRMPAHASLWAQGFDDEIHQPVRFQIMSLLRAVRGRELMFTVIRDFLGLKDGNLTHHLDRLDRLDYVQTYEVQDGRRRMTGVALTRAGREAYKRHVQALHALVGSADPFQPAPSSSLRSGQQQLREAAGGEVGAHGGHGEEERDVTEQRQVDVTEGQ